MWRDSRSEPEALRRPSAGNRVTVAPDYCLCQFRAWIFYDEALDTTAAFAHVLLRFRQERGLTHEVLAERAGLHPTTISLLERGRRQPSLGTIFMLARGLTVEPERLVREVRKLRPKLPT